MKYLIAILLLISTAKAQYIIVPSENKAKAISKKCYQLSRPVKGDDVTEYLFDWFVNDSTGQAAVNVDSTINIPKGNITLSQVDNWITELYGNSLTNTQKNQIRNYVSNNNLIPVKLILQYLKVTIYDYQYFIDNGWFKTEEL
jgi:hypothetical protein